MLKALFVIFTTLMAGVRSELSCKEQCDAAYSDPVGADLCTHACTSAPELFHVDFPYMIGPLKLQPYPELTNVDPEELKNLTGELWARVNVDRTKMQFYYQMDHNPEPFFPYFA